MTASIRFVARLLAMPLAFAPANAETIAATPSSFEIKQVVTVDAPIAQVWATLLVPQRWWSKDHTYSDDSANLFLDPQATGCFCEKLPDHGSVEHARILYIQPPRMMRLSGALGPLQAEAVTGTLTLKLDPDGKKATTVTFDYVVSGYVRAGADTLAPEVDEVLALQMVNLKTAAELPPPAEVPQPGR